MVAAALFVALAPGNAWGGTLKVYYTTDKAKTDSKPCRDGENQWDKVGDDNKLPETTLQKGKCIWIACCNVVDGEKIKSFALKISTEEGGPDLRELAYYSAEGFPTADDDRPDTGSHREGGKYSSSERVIFHLWTPQPEWERFQFCATEDITLKDVKIRAWSHCANEWRDPPQLNIRGGNFGAHGAVFGDPHIIQVLIFPQVVPVDPGFQPLFNAPPHTGVWRTGLTHFDPQGNHYPGGGYYFETDGPGLATGDLYDLTMTMMGDADMRYDLFAFEVESGEWQDYVLAAGQIGFHDDFDAYPPGEDVCGHGHWEVWEGGGDNCGQISQDQSFSPGNSLRVSGLEGPTGDDIVRRFDIVGGVWEFKSKVYVPVDATGQGWIIFLNQYPRNMNWSLQIVFDATRNLIFNSHNTQQRLPLVKGQWAEITMRVDLDGDVAEAWYEGQPFITNWSWRNGLGGNGQPWIHALDLYGGEPNAGGISAIYFDDVRLDEVLFGSCCMGQTGECRDDVTNLECAQVEGLFREATACADWDPPCGQHGCTRQPQWVCDGDVDGNGTVNPVDVGLVQAAFCSPGDCPEASLCQFDVDCNAAINPVDAGIVQSLFGACNPPRPSCP
jgi:hypothetical protein